MKNNICKVCGNDFIPHKKYKNKGKKVTSGKCVLCFDELNAEKSRLYYERHKEERKEYAKKYRKEHKKYRNKMARKYYIKNREKFSLKHKLYYERKKNEPKKRNGMDA